ncbi:hypothetical protein GCM10027429_01960 [Marivirga atlantica]|jgi:hypothetical protein|uniref:DUF6089 domain-containing protein n=1 Tax=Marivirga atlantica TaxID=1548457 RepID=A0A937ACP9_9BACT|nr:DUF6089 family protein [Marivirga atlantica]MBL0763808.1 hypothetical protein [Marivirga atlantica]
MRKVILLFSIVMSAMMVLPESADAQLFGGRNKRRKSSRKIGSFSGSKRAFNPEITYFAIGGGINALNYFGDIAPRPSTFSTDISFTRPGFNIFLKQKFGDRFSWRANFMWGRLQASDQETIGTKNFNQENANRYLRNLSFRNDILELSLTGQVDIFKHGGRFASRPILNIYAFGGLGIIYHNPKGQVPNFATTDAFIVDNPEDFQGGSSPRYIELENAGEWVSLRELGTEGQNFTAAQRARYDTLYNHDLPDPYSRFQIVIPLGIGARYKLTNNIDLGLEFSFRYTFTDYLDDVSGRYVDLGDFLENGQENDNLVAFAMSDMSNQFSGEDFGSITQATYTDRVNVNESNSEYPIVYRRAAGYGWPGGPAERTFNNRGDGGAENDIYIVTNISLTYILGGGFVRGAKFR